VAEAERLLGVGTTSGDAVAAGKSSNASQGGD
jgi:hypothetical protein